MISKLINKIIKYNGSMEYRPLSDADINDNYQHDFVVEHYKDYIEGKKVLDAGCWTGPLEKVIVKKNIATKLLGVDINQDALSVARRNFPDFDFQYCALRGSNKKDDSFVKNYSSFFDTVIFLDVIEHLPKNTEHDVIRLFHRLLKNNGTLIVSTMASHPLNLIDPAWLLGHRHYRLKYLRKIFQDAGFEPTEIIRCGNLYWDLDLLYFYVYKHLFKKKYRTSEEMLRKIRRGLTKQIMPTRYYVKAKKI